MVGKTNRMRTYRELIQIPDFFGRFNYLKLNGVTFEMNEEVNRALNQYFYHTPEWQKVRREVLIRDGGFDLGIKDRLIVGRPLVHHIEPLTKRDILDRSERVFDLDNLILVSHETHNAIHYGSEDLLTKDYVARTPGDTCPWK